jgi:hypothetical protein
MSEVHDTAFSSVQNLQVYPDGVERNFWHTARNRLLVNYLQKYRAEPLLEIGAGRGLVLAALRAAGWDAQGVELSETSPRWPDLPIWYGQDAFTLPVSTREQYRSIALFDVLEHIPERVAFLHSLRDHFPRMKYLYLTVPAAPELWSNYDEFCKHYLRYTRATLQEELLKAGYKVVFQRYFFHSLYWAIWLALRIGKKREERFTPPTGLMAWVHKAIGMAFYAEGRLLPPSWRGSSLLAVAEPL